MEISLAERLRDLRSRLLLSLLGVSIGTAVGYLYWHRILKILTIPLAGTSVHLINTSPLEAFINSIKVALTAGIMISSPWILWNLWQLAGFNIGKIGKASFFNVFLLSILLFPAGALFCFYTVLPYGVRFFAEYTQGAVSPQWSQAEYVGLVLKMEIVFGIVFELPMLAYVLTRLGIIDYRMLWQFGRYAIVIIFIVAALLTPPDPFTQIVLAIPLCILYLIAILVSFLSSKSIKKA